jgi:hypothetical protein
MKNKKHVYLWFILLASVFLFSNLFAQGLKKDMNVGEVRWIIVDSADEGEGSWGWGEDRTFSRGYEDEFESTKCLMLACRDWTDTLGVQHSVKVSGHGQWEVDELHILMPVPDAEEATIRRYYRYQPPGITVDGVSTQDPFPVDYTDAVAPEKIPGNADGLIESFINTDMGVSIHHRAIGYAQKNHDQYLIIEYIFKNTGNVNLDDDAELEGQVINDFYFLKQIRPKEWPQRPWTSVKGVYPGDELRIMYGYPSREEEADFDHLGDPDVENGTGYLNNTSAAGEALLFASAGPGADFNTNDPNQPHATMHLDVDFEGFTWHSLTMNDSQRDLLYEVMQFGATNLEGIYWPLLSGTKPGYHGVPQDERGFAYITEMEGFGFSSSVAWSAGPYTLNPGDSIKIVIAKVYGNLSPEKALEIGEDWINDDCHWGDDVIGGVTDILPPQYVAHPELYEADDFASESSNWAKDNWVMSSLDSLFQNARAALFAYNNNYTVPEPPPPPSLTVQSLPDYIKLTWGTESEAANDLAGYRIYRARDSWWAGIPYGESEYIGGWELIAEVGSGVHEYLDSDTQPGPAYFYVVTAIDDGSANGTNFKGQANVPLESNIAANATQKAAYRLQQAAPNLDDVVIVPNPFNLAASQFQFRGEEENKIAFYNVPTKCTIRIFTEAGDLVQTIEHEGSGLAFWGGDATEFSATRTGQIISSGIYIAHFETPDGETALRKFVVVR